MMHSITDHKHKITIHYNGDMEGDAVITWDTARWGAGDCNPHGIGSATVNCESLYNGTFIPKLSSAVPPLQVATRAVALMLDAKWCRHVVNATEDGMLKW